MTGHRQSLPGPGVQLLTDMVITLFIITILFSIASYSMTMLHNRVKAGVPPIEAIGLWRNYMMAYSALYGEWPESKDAMVPLVSAMDRQVTGVDESGYDFISSSKGLGFSGGAMDVTLKGVHEGKVITVHPAVPSGDPLGPVRFIAGGRAPEGWSLIGPDHTTIERDMIYPRIIVR